MRGWQAKKRRTCALPVDKGYARKCKTTRSAGGYLLYLSGVFDKNGAGGRSGSGIGKIRLSACGLRKYEDLRENDIKAKRRFYF